MQTFCIVILCLFGLIYSQVDLIVDPGLYSLSGMQCSSENQWHFRSDYVWNDTSEFINARCDASFEIPTPVKPGISKGDQTNINKAIIPTLPTVTGAINGWANSAGVVDMNSPCRSALWAPFTLTHDAATINKISLKLWVRSNDQIQQMLLPNSSVSNSTLLQYLPEPDGLLSEDLSSFPPIVEETNEIRIDVILPDSNGHFYDRAFSVDPAHILVNIPVPGFDQGFVVSADGTDDWIQITFDATSALDTAGTYALRVAGAQSQIGVSWGITDVHVLTSGGVKRKKREEERSVGLYEVESVGQEIFGELTHTVPSRMVAF